MSTAAWLTIAAGFALAFGSSLFVLGWRGRRLDDHPCCRRCGFDLDGLGLDADGARCPECGRAVGEDGSRARRRAVRIGRRKKRPIVATLGAALVCVVGLPGGGVACLLWSGADVDNYKPVWWLIHESGSERDITAEAARDELRRRMVEDDISASGARAVARAALARQTAETGWHPEWGSLFEIAWLGGWLDQSMTDQYLRNAIRFRVVKGEVEEGAPTGGLRLDLQLEDRTGEVLLLAVRAALRVPEDGSIEQATAGEFNLSGRLGGGSEAVAPWSPAGQTTRKAWFAGLAISPGAGQSATGGGGIAALMASTPGAPLPGAVRLSPWPSSWSRDLSIQEPTAYARQYLRAKAGQETAGTTLRLEALVWTPMGGRGGSGVLSSWWSQRPVPILDDPKGVRWDEELRVGR